MSYTKQVAGEPLDQTVFQYGPFVMTTREEIQQTLRDCESFSATLCFHSDQLRSQIKWGRMDSKRHIPGKVKLGSSETAVYVSLWDFFGTFWDRKHLHIYSLLILHCMKLFS